MIYEIADLRIDICNRLEYTTRFCAGYLSEDQTTPAHFRVAVTDEQFRAEKAASPDYSDGYIENICIYRNICLEMPKYDRMLLHACVLSYDEKGYAFLGRSGTGKSTHSRLWLQYLPSAFIVNGDKPILAFDGEKVYAYGTPWMGKEGLGKRTKVALNGLCFLRQAKENSLQKLDALQASRLLFLQILMPSEEETAARTLELADRLLTVVPAYLLDCNISKEAVQVSFEGMTGAEFLPEGENNED